ncbi:MAG: ComEC/Rec2 family competence protein, partial [Lachnospiraceae bacterium]|nr:ComEC/Rec2 family competence protein [Lachnospiraceae bacterium]
MCLFALSFIFGTVLYCRSEDVWPAVLLLLGAAIGFPLLAGRRKKESMVLAGICMILILTAFFRCRYLDLSYFQIQSSVSTGVDTELTGVIYQKEIKSNTYLYYLRTQYKTILIYFDSDEIPIGSVVAARGELESFSHATNEGVFDLAGYYQYQNISFRMFADEVTPTDVPGRSFRECLYQLQKHVSDVFSSELNARDAGVLATLVTGNKGLLDQEVKELYQDAGISHILAISGLHISVLGLGVFRFLRRIRCSYPVSAIVGSTVVVCFVIMSGMGVSSRRALIMYLLLMGAEVMGRAYDSLNALSIATLILLIQNPMNLYQSGFQFSFLAMGAIVLSSQVTRKLREERGSVCSRVRIFAKRGGVFSRMEFSGKKGVCSVPQDCEAELTTARRFMQGLAERLQSGAFLQLFLLPLTAWIYYEVPMYALFLNMLVLPLCSWLLGAGLLGGLLGLYFTQISKCILILCHFILLLYEKSIAVVNYLPFSQVITGKPSAWMLLLYYVLLVGACLWYLGKKADSGVCESSQNSEMQHRSSDSEMRNRYSDSEMRHRPPDFEMRNRYSDSEIWHRYPDSGIRDRFPDSGTQERYPDSGMRYSHPGFTLIRFACFLPVILLICILFLPKREGCRVDFLDVGQGDGIYLSDGDGMHVMIDGGSSSENEVGAYRIEPFLKYHAVKKIDVWILTHGDADHYSGLLELLEDGYPVGYLLLAKSMPEDETRETLIEAAKANGTEVVFVETGDSIRLEDAEMTCLYPSSEDTGDDTNALSQVWVFKKDGMSMLFTGDIGEEQ